MILSIHGHRSQFNFKEYNICVTVCAVSYNRVISNTDTDIMTKNVNASSSSSTLLNTRGGTVLLLLFWNWKGSDPEF